MTNGAGGLCEVWETAFDHMSVDPTTSEDGLMNCSQEPLPGVHPVPLFTSIPSERPGRESKSDEKSALGVPLVDQGKRLSNPLGVVAGG